MKVSRICLGAMTYGSKKWREWDVPGPATRAAYRWVGGRALT